MLPPLQLMPMPQKMSSEEGVTFWHGLDLEIGEELELGVPPPDIWLEDVVRRVWWGLEPEPVEEDPPLPALGAEPMEVEGGTEQAQQNGAAAEDNVMVE